MTQQEMVAWVESNEFSPTNDQVYLGVIQGTIMRVLISEETYRFEASQTVREPDSEETFTAWRPIATGKVDHLRMKDGKLIGLKMLKIK